MEEFKYKLPMGKKILKKRIPYKKLSPIQQKIYKRIYDPINGPLEFAEHCCYANRNGVVQYIPYDYQREMIFNMHNYSSIISMFGRQQGKCVCSQTLIKLRNKNNGEVFEMTIEDLLNMIKNKENK